MAKIDDLRKKVAEILNVSENVISDEFVIKAGRLKTSAGSVILNNIIKKVYGVEVDSKNVSTFGELKKLLEGDSSVNNISEYTEVKNDSSNCNNIIQDNELKIGKLVCGIDIQAVDIFPIVKDYWDEAFYFENFTKKEIAYCVTSPSPVMSFAGRWCVKEALHKCAKEYYNIPLNNIQILKKNDGLLAIEILNSSGNWERLSFSCSISHDKNYAVGMVTGFDRR